MKAFKKSIFYVFAAAILTSCGDKPNVEANYWVVPLPQEINLKNSAPTNLAEHFTLNSQTKIAYPDRNNKELKQTAEFLKEYIKFATGLSLDTTTYSYQHIKLDPKTEELIVDTKDLENVIILRTGYEGEGNIEAYNLTVNEKQIVINGKTPAGTFYGVQTLRKSIPAEATNNTVIFPVVEIKDYPRFEYRGMHLDVGRHFFPAEFIKKYIDILALHNINKFHWHLTEDQGWRIEIKKYPELTTIGSQREQTVIGHNTAEFDGKPYGGYYTQDEIKDIVDYAQKRFITIIPEIDLPGHMLAALTAYPNLGCTGGPYKVGQQWGVFDDVLCAGNDSVYTFLDNVFSEIIELFPSEYIHVGGDECPKVRWEKCPKCQAKIKELGLKSDAEHSKEDRLQSHVIAHVEKFLNSKGRQIIGWDEILEGGLAPNATVMSWRGMDGGITAAKQHHKVVMTPNSHAYFDHYQSKEVQNEPLAIGGFIPLEKVYSFEPVPSTLADEEKKYVIGAQANLWTEYIPESKQVEYMILPRIAALAEVQWTMPEKKDYKTFLPRLERLLNLYKKLGYNYATHISDISSELATDTDKGTITLSLFTYDNAPIYYTLDGSEPTEKSTLYTEPIVIKSTTDIKAVAFRGKEKTKTYTNSFSFNKATMKNIELENAPHRNYTYKGAVTLVDGKRGTASFDSGEWLGFYGKDFVAIIDLKETTEVSEVTIGTFVDTKSWIFGATEYIIELSDDGKTFRQAFDEKYPVWGENEHKGSMFDLTAKFATEKARYVKITAKLTNSIPDWHPGTGKPAFLFLDEIIVKCG
jgi:hexosaminidase